MKYSDDQMDEQARAYADLNQNTATVRAMLKQVLKVKAQRMLPWIVLSVLAAGMAWTRRRT